MEHLLDPGIVWDVLEGQTVHIGHVLPQALGGNTGSETVLHETRYIGPISERNRTLPNSAILSLDHFYFQLFVHI